ncbi:SCO family protein [Crocinitomicaceae bacterium]|jgi:cytochrome oxidase Cu insertion factor (SCO1/SenC/PrrC family)|nr:SCO family protein [Crocinitomicaceae bacterium]
MLVFGPAVIFISMTLFMTRSCEHKFETLENYGTITSFNFTDVNGNKRSSLDFKGDIVLISTIQESCPDSCSVLLWNINQTIYQRIWNNRTKKRKQVKILSFVTDGNGDPIKDLSPIEDLLKKIVPNYDPSIWVLAKGDVKSIYNIEHNGASLLQDGNKFQELMLLMDKKQCLRMVLSGKKEGHIRRMEQSMALLQKEYDKANSN